MFSVRIVVHILPCATVVLQCFNLLIFQPFPVARKPHISVDWAEQLPLFGQLLIYRVLYLPVFSAHMPSFCLSYTGGDEAFCLGGGGGGLKPSVWCEGGGVHAVCAACLVILWRHLSTSKLSSGDVSAHLSCLALWISFWYICTSAIENVS